VTATAGYPTNPAERSRWIAQRRGAKSSLPPDRAYAQLIERERMEDGRIADVATIFLTNRECPWKCVMCDLWRNTSPVAEGSIPKQIEAALQQLNYARQPEVLKLYNSGSFFDAGAIPKSDWLSIAKLCRGFDRVIVECHPRLVNGAVLEFAGMIDGILEVAMGLETCHPDALEKINKRITVEHFRSAADFLRANGMSVRTFLLVGVPFIAEHEQATWCERSINTAFDAGTNVVSLIPTRLGNGALDELRALGNFREPRFEELEAAQEFGLRRNAGRVFADTWDAERFGQCERCASSRIQRLNRMNLSQEIIPRVECVCAS
jgi:radical SAM enzyme (TIGR01210 family)